jgi:uncharacterized membrane protein YtjA (UPF0391 family)
MLNWAITFLVIGLIAGLLGLSGLAGAATEIAWIRVNPFLLTGTWIVLRDLL